VGATKFVGGIAVDLIARTTKWRDGFRKASRDQKRFASGVKSAVAQIGAYVGAAFAVQRVASAFNETRKAIDNMAKASARLGISTQSYAAFSLAARKAGSSVEQMQQALTYMTRNIGEAALGNKELAKTFAKLGIDVAKIRDMAPDEQYKILADRISRLGSVSERTSVTMDIFGRSGAGMLNLIAGGANAIEDAARKTQAFGTAIDQHAAKRVEEMNDAMTDLGEAWGGVKTRLVTEIAPAMTELLKLTTDYLAGVEQAAVNWQAVKRIQDEIRKNAEIGPVSVLGGGQQVVGASELKGGSLADLAKNAGGVAGLIGGQQVAGAIGLKGGSLADLAKNAGRVAGLGDVSLATLTEEAYSQRLAVIEESRTKEQELQWEFDEQRINEWYDITKAYEEQERRKTAIAKQEADRRRGIFQQDAQFIISGLQQIANTADMSARERFEAEKALAIASTIVNTATAVMKYHSDGRVGMAWTVGLIGAAQVATIASTTFDGGGSGASAASATPALESDNALERKPQQVNVILPEGTGMFSRNQVIALMEQINETTGDGYTLNMG
jgi:hypothetical protein